MKLLQEIEIILFVHDQQVSTSFYENVFQTKALLNVPGMTEIKISDHCKLGLMPNTGIQRILNNEMPHPETGRGIPRCELYLMVDNFDQQIQHLLSCGARQISAAEDRDWGHRVAYFADPDGHLLAIAKTINPS